MYKTRNKIFFTLIFINKLFILFIYKHFICSFMRFFLNINIKLIYVLVINKYVIENKLNIKHKILIDNINIYDK